MKNTKREKVDGFLKLFLYVIITLGALLAIYLAIEGQLTYGSLIKSLLLSVFLLIGITFLTPHAKHGPSASPITMKTSSTNQNIRIPRIRARRHNIGLHHASSAAAEVYTHLDERRGEVSWRCSNCHHFVKLYDVGDERKSFKHHTNCPYCRASVNIVR